MVSYDPTPADRFTFGLWTVGNPGRDPFGAPVRPLLSPDDLVRGLADCGAWGVNFHDNDLVPFDATPQERDRIVTSFQRALQETGLVVPMATVNLFSHPVFKDGALTANDSRVRAFALRKTLDAIDLGVELGAKTFVLWGGREGVETDACRDPREAIRRFRRALNYLCAYVRDRGYDLRFALEAKPNEPRGDIYFSTTGHMLHLIETLEEPSRVGVNPEVAHETMAGLSFLHAVAQAMEVDKLFHIDLNAQRIGRYDQDLRFGSEDLKQAFLLVRLLEGTSGTEPYKGPLHFDAHAYRSEDQDGVWDFAKGCMRTYKILTARAQSFDADPEVKEILRLHDAPEDKAAHEEAAALIDRFHPEALQSLRELALDPDALATKGLGYERLDQLLVEHMLGIRD